MATPRPAARTAAVIARLAGWRRELVLSVLSQLIQKLPGLVAAVVLARSFDQSLMGSFFFLGVVASLAATASHLGTDRELRRSVANRPEAALEMLGQVLPLRMAASLGLWLLIVAVVAVWSPALLPLAALTSAYVLVGDIAFTFTSVFVGLRWAGLRLAVGAVGPLLIVLASLAVLRGASLTTVLALYCLANGLMVAVAVWATRVRLGRPPLQWRWEGVRPILRASWPFLVTEVVLLVQGKVDTLMLYALRTPAEVAEYETSYRLLEVTRTLIRPLTMVFVPIAAAMAATGAWPALSALIRRLLVFVGLAGALLAALGVGLAEPLVTLVWGEAYRQSASIFAVLALATMPLFLSLAALHLAGALHRERVCLWILVTTALANAAANAVVIPVHGAVGAAWTTLGTEAVAAVLLVLLVLRASRRAG